MLVALPVTPAVPGVTTKFAVPWIDKREPGVEVLMPMLPVELAIVRYVLVDVLKLLIVPIPRLPKVVEANQ